MTITAPNLTIDSSLEAGIIHAQWLAREHCAGNQLDYTIAEAAQWALARTGVTWAIYSRVYDRAVAKCSGLVAV